MKFIFALLLLCTTARAGTFVMGLAQQLTNQQGWLTWFSGTDSPEGAFLATIRVSSNSVTGVIPLGTTVTPGRYYLSFKLYDYGKGGLLDATLGGASIQVTNLVPGGLSGWWTVPNVIDVVSSTNAMRITVNRTSTVATNAQQLYLMRGLYLSTTTNLFVGGSDEVMDFNFPSLSGLPDIAGNQLENGGFETGLGHGWGLKEATSRAFTLKSILDTTTAHTGTNSVKIPNLAELVSKVYRLRGNRPYTFSAWVSNGVNGTVTLKMANVTTAAPSGLQAPSSLSVAISVAAGAWRHVSITTNLMSYPTGDFQFRILGNDPTGGFTWIDDVMVSEGTDDTYVPKSFLELGLNTLAQANLFTNGEPAAYSIKVRNTLGTPTNAVVRYDVYDYLNARIATATNSLAVGDGETATLNLNLPPVAAAPPQTVGDTIVVAKDGSGDFTTITAAYATATAGDTILVMPGTYTEIAEFGGLYLDRNGTAGNPITLRSHVKWGAVLDGLNQSTNYNIIALDANYNTIDGFEIARSFKGAMNIWSGHHCRVINNYIHDNGGASDPDAIYGQGGIFAHQSTHHNEYTGNYIFRNGRIGLPHGTSDHGLYLCGDNDLVANNIVTHSAGWGLQIAGYTDVTGMLVYNNVFAQNGQAGIVLWMDLSGVLIKNNIFYKNTTSGINAYDGHGSGMVIDHNIFFGNLTSATDLSRGGSDFTYSLVNSITSDPDFVNELSDYRTVAGSPAIDAGLALTPVVTDYALIPRPQAGSYDIGAYEYNPYGPGKFGVNRVFAWIDGFDGTLDEMMFTVMPQIQSTTTADSGILGTHAEFSDLQFGTMRKLGITWTRTASSGAYFRWAIAEPTEGNFVWFDSAISKAADYGINILATFGQSESIPAYALTNGVVNLEKWGTFATNVIAHYASVVDTWQPWNEANYTMTPSAYGDILRIAVAAVNSQDPGARIVSFSGAADASWVQQVLTYLGGAATNWASASDTHQYPLASPTTLQNYYNFSTGVGLPVWNTEAGVWCQGYYLGGNSDYIGFLEYGFPHLDSARFQYGGRAASELAAQSFLRTIGTGYARYVYYDSRITIGPGQQDSHSTTFDFDDSSRPKGVALGAAVSLFENSLGVGAVINNSTTTSYLFDRADGTPLAAIWGVGSRSITVPLTTNQLEVYDNMGNQIPFSGVVRYGSSPVFLKGLSLTTNELKTALQANVSVTSSDTTPPNLSITQFYPGPISTNDTAYFRFLGVDETSLPSLSEPNAIQYQKKLTPWDADWSDWNAGARAQYDGLTNGAYILSVKARDQALNESAIEVPLQVGPYSSAVLNTNPPTVILNFASTSGGTTPNTGSSASVATMLNGAKILGGGHDGSGLSLNGLGAIVSVSPAGINLTSTGSFTAALWLKTPVRRAVNSTILSSQPSPSSGGFSMASLNMSQSVLWARVRDMAGQDTGYVSNPMSSVINDGNWHLVAITVDRSIGSLVLWTDGVKSSPVDISSFGSLVSSAKVIVGGPFNSFKGMLDQAQWWDRVLTDNEILLLP